MSNGQVFGIFLGFLTGVIWMLLSVLGVIGDVLAIFNLGSLTTILNFLIALIGFLASLLFGLGIFKKVWQMLK
jgi:hypothetical protein